MNAICYACDDNYALQVAVSLKSLCENGNLDNDDMVFILGDNLCERSIKYLQTVSEKSDRKLEFIDTQDVIEEIKNSGLISNVDNASLSTYVRLFIEKYIPAIYRNVLYIDADTIILKPINDMLQFEMDKTAYAVVDIMPEKYKSIINLTERYYFNCGILLIDMDKWRNNRCEQRILNHINSIYCKYLYADQDVINIVLKDEIGVLPLKYNVFPFYSELEYDCLCDYMGGGQYYYSKDQYLAAQNSPVIVHLVYSVEDRPWFEGNLNKYNDVWWEYVRRTPWSDFISKKRKLYSRTKIMQYIYRVFGAKSVIRIQKQLNERAFSKAKSRYEMDGIIDVS